MPKNCMYFVTLSVETATNVHALCRIKLAEECLIGVTFIRFQNTGRV